MSGNTGSETRIPVPPMSGNTGSETQIPVSPMSGNTGSETQIPVPPMSGNTGSETRIPGVIVHGGAWSIPDHLADASRAGVRLAASRAYRILQDGGSAIDAVEEAVRILEDDPAFDAGTGSVLNDKGEVEMDAVIMDGRNLRAGGVACVQNIVHPISLARLVMDKTEHTLLVGTGANDFASEMNIARVAPETLVTPEARSDLERFRSYRSAVIQLFEAEGVVDENTQQHKQDIKMAAGVSGHDTVGAAAIDIQGNVAYATSTGGITGKRPGRVGDSPIIGSGGYADNVIGAVSCTGHGESINKVCLAFRIISEMGRGSDGESACRESLQYMADRVGGAGGVVVVDRHGTLSHKCNTHRMAWASVNNGMLHSGLEPDEDVVENWS